MASAPRRSRLSAGPARPRGAAASGSAHGARASSSPAKIRSTARVVQPLVGADRRAVERRLDHLGAAQLELHGQRHASTSRAQRAGVVAQRLRQHRLHPPGDVDARGAAVGLAVDGRAGRHEGADVGDVDPDAPVLGADRLGADRVVEVARRRRVDGEGRQAVRSRRTTCCASRPPAWPASRASRAARSTPGGKRRCRPRSSMSASSTAPALSGRPMTRAIRAWPRVRWAVCSRTRSPGLASRTRSTTTRGPRSKNGLGRQMAPAAVEDRDQLLAHRPRIVRSPAAAAGPRRPRARRASARPRPRGAGPRPRGLTGPGPAPRRPSAPRARPRPGGSTGRPRPPRPA